MSSENSSTSSNRNRNAFSGAVLRGSKIVVPPMSMPLPARSVSDPSHQQSSQDIRQQEVEELDLHIDLNGELEVGDLELDEEKAEIR